MEMEVSHVLHYNAKQKLTWFYFFLALNVIFLWYDLGLLQLHLLCYLMQVLHKAHYQLHYLLLTEKVTPDMSQIIRWHRMCAIIMHQWWWWARVQDGVQSGTASSSPTLNAVEVMKTFCKCEMNLKMLSLTTVDVCVSTSWTGWTTSGLWYKRIRVNSTVWEEQGFSVSNDHFRGLLQLCCTLSCLFHISLEGNNSSTDRDARQCYVGHCGGVEWEICARQSILSSAWIPVCPKSFELCCSQTLYQLSAHCQHLFIMSDCIFNLIQEANFEIYGFFLHLTGVMEIQCWFCLDCFILFYYNSFLKIPACN